MGDSTFKLALIKCGYNSYKDLFLRNPAEIHPCESGIIYTNVRTFQIFHPESRKKTRSAKPKKYDSKFQPTSHNSLETADGDGSC